MSNPRGTSPAAPTTLHEEVEEYVYETREYGSDSDDCSYAPTDEEKKTRQNMMRRKRPRDPSVGVDASPAPDALQTLASQHMQAADEARAIPATRAGVTDDAIGAKALEGIVHPSTMPSIMMRALTTCSAEVLIKELLVARARIQSLEGRVQTLEVESAALREAFDAQVAKNADLYARLPKTDDDLPKTTDDAPADSPEAPQQFVKVPFDRATHPEPASWSAPGAKIGKKAKSEYYTRLREAHNAQQAKLALAFNRAAQEAAARAKALVDEAAERDRQRTADWNSFIKKANEELGLLINNKRNGDESNEKAPRKRSTKPATVNKYENRMVELCKLGVEAKGLSDLMDVNWGTLRSWVNRSNETQNAEAAAIQGDSLC